MSTELKTDDTSVAVKILVGILVGPALVLGMCVVALVTVVLALALLVWSAAMTWDVVVVLPLAIGERALQAIFKPMTGSATGERP